jgi:hypothetical protein
MKKVIPAFIAGFSFFLTGLYAQTSTPIPVNQPSQTRSITRITDGPSVYGAFDGRTPCQEFARDRNIEASTACTKIKCRLTLYQDSVTHQPAAFKLYAKKIWEGKWHIVQGTGTDARAIVYQLDPDDKSGPLFLLKGDDNVLFILDKNKNFLTGNASHSYTLNRVRNYTGH